MTDFVGNERFELRRLLGQGGFGLVYEAFDREMGASVALKVLARHAASDLLRFKREFRALTDISHPNLVKLYELQQDGNVWFFTMELVRGGDWVKYLRYRPPLDDDDLSGDTTAITAAAQRPIVRSGDATRPQTLPPRSWSERDVPRVNETVAQLVRGVSRLHELGMLHRDLKPSNVLVTSEGRLVLLDFGLVRQFDSEEATDSYRLIGTPRYMSPEQAAGRKLDPASDWYSVGVMLYEALTGRVPFSGPTNRILAAKQENEAPAAEEINPTVPAGLATLCKRLLRRDVRERPGAAEILHAVGEAAPEVSHGSGKTPSSERTPFVGRVEQLNVLFNALAECRAGRTVIVDVSGTSGIGKTALVRQFLDSVRDERDLLIFSGRCYEQESVPYKGVDGLVDAMSRHLKHLTEREQELLLPRNAGALARLFPVLRQVDALAEGRLATPELASSQELRRRAFGAMRELVARLGERRSIIFFVDDFQWGDLDSAVLLEELVRPPDPPPLLIVGTHRKEEEQTSAFLRYILPRLRNVGPPLVVRDVELAPLAKSEARTLVSALVGARGEAADKQADAIYHEAKGNPFFVGELVRFGQALPASKSDEVDLDVRLKNAIESRLSRLAPMQRSFLEIVAVGGRPLPIGVAAAAADVGEHVQEIVTVLRAERLLRVRSSRDAELLEPYHDRIRQAIIGVLDSEALKERHKRLAAALVTKETQAEMLAVHLLGAGDEQGAAHYAIRAARNAAQALAFDQASRMFQMAKVLGGFKGPHENELQVALAETLANAGRGPEAAEAFREATLTADPGARLDLRRRAADQLLQSGHVDAGLKACREVLASVGVPLLSSRWLRIASWLWYRLRLRLRGLRFRERGAGGISPNELTRIDMFWSVAVGLGTVDPLHGAELNARHLLLALEAGEPYRVSRALALESSFRGIPGARRRAEVEDLSRRARALAARTGNPHAIAFATLAAGMAAYLWGEWRHSRELLEKAEQLFRDGCSGVQWELDRAQLFALLNSTMLGDFAHLRRRFPELMTEASDRGDVFLSTGLSARVGYLVYLARDRPEAARRLAAEAAEQWSSSGSHLQHLWILCSEVECDLYEGDAPAAWQRLSAGWGRIKAGRILDIQVPRILALWLRGRCALASSMGESSSLSRAEADAVRIGAEDPAWGQAMALLLRAGIAARRGDPNRAVELLFEAEAGFSNSEMSLHATLAKLRRGQLLGAGRGDEDVADARERLTGWGVEAPDRIARMLAPMPIP